MVSDDFRNLEDKVASVLSLHEEIAKEIAQKLKKEELDVNMALYTAGIASGTRSSEVGFIVNEFLIALSEKSKVSE